MVVIRGATLFFAVKEKEKEFHFLVFTAALLTLSFVFGELLRRLSLLSEEFKHKRTRYQRKPRFRHFVFFFNCFVVPQLLYQVGVQQLSPVETSDLNERGNKNVADGLAWSCYFDYLKLVNCQN